jgi:23S rRNA (cytidine1920-2'-O)/16S rRNA (cytidine1409-2'-O)-methyltransferase
VRLDAELVRRGLARSRSEAVALVEAGQVRVNGIRASKATTGVDGGTPIVVTGAERRWVSRGAHKLLGALDAFSGIEVAGRRCLDAGASTGGFTEVLLDRGARSVAAVDVGYGQLAWPLRNDERVHVLERRNVRELGPDELDGPVELTVADLSFISLRTVLPALARCTRTDGDLLLMVKPQFEVGREVVGDGVIRDPDLRAAAVAAVAAEARRTGLGSVGVVASPLPGPAGNVEYFLWLRPFSPGGGPGPVGAGSGAGHLDAQALATAIGTAVADGPG